MDWNGCLLSLALPLSVLVIGSWRLAVFDREPSPQPALLDSAQALGHDFARTPPGTFPLASNIRLG